MNKMYLIVLSNFLLNSRIDFLVAYLDSYRKRVRPSWNGQPPLGWKLLTLETQLHGITTVFHAVVSRGSTTSNQVEVGHSSSV